MSLLQKLQKSYQAPLPAILALLIVYVWQGLGHTVMYLMEHRWFPEQVFLAAFLLGLIGAIMVWIGRNKSENAATLLGFVGGSLIWLSWIEFSFVYVADELGVSPVVWGAKETLAEYRVMLSSIGVMFATLVYFLLNKETKCNFFLWFQRNLGLKTGRPSPGHERNFAAITALETVYVIWFFYLLLLFIYDESILGDRHPVTYGIFFLNVIWAVYLFQRLMKFWKVTTAIRYGIPTAIIAWNAVEIAGRWHLFTEFWEHPQDYALEMTLLTSGVVIAALLAARTPAHRKAALTRQPPAATSG